MQVQIPLLTPFVGDFSSRVKSFLFCVLEHDNTVSKERLKFFNYLLIILLYTCLCTNIYKMFSHHYVSQVRNPFCSPLFSLLKPETHCTLSLFSRHNSETHCTHLSTVESSALYRQIGRASRTWYLRPGRKLGTQQYTTQALQPCCFEHKYNTHTVQCGYGCSTVTANLWLRPIYGCGHSTVAATLRLWPIYGFGQSTVTVNLRLRPICGCGQSTVAANLQLRPLYFVTMASLPITVTVLLYLDHMHYQSATLVQ